jgi:hypothetical protein
MTDDVKPPTAAVIRRRRTQYGPHWPVGLPLRASRVPEILRDQPEFVELEAERQATLAAEMRLRREHAEWQQKTRLAHAQHHKAIEEAIRNGTPPPPRPQVEPWWGLDGFNRDLIGLDGSPAVGSAEKELFDQMLGCIEAAELGLLEENHKRYLKMVSKMAEPVSARHREAVAVVSETEERLGRFATAERSIKRACGLDDKPRPGEVTVDRGDGRGSRVLVGSRAAAVAVDEPRAPAEWPPPRPVRRYGPR